MNLGSDIGEKTVQDALGVVDSKTIPEVQTAAQSVGEGLIEKLGAMIDEKLDRLEALVNSFSASVKLDLTTKK